MSYHSHEGSIPFTRSKKRLLFSEDTHRSQHFIFLFGARATRLPGFRGLRFFGGAGEVQFEQSGKDFIVA